MLFLFLLNLKKGLKIVYGIVSVAGSILVLILKIYEYIFIHYPTELLIYDTCATQKITSTSYKHKAIYFEQEIIFYL